MRTRRRSSNHRSQEINNVQADENRMFSKNAKDDIKLSIKKSSLKKKDVVLLIDSNSNSRRSKRLKHNIMGHENDYYNLHYKYDDPSDNNAYFNNLDLYSAQDHKFLNETVIVGENDTILELNAEFLFNLNEFNNNLYQRNDNTSYRKILKRKRHNTFTKREMNSFYKIANQKHNFRGEVASSEEEDEQNDTEEEDFDKNKVLATCDEIQISDDDEETENENLILEGLYCQGIVLLENEHIQLYGIATKNGYLNFKIIDKQTRANRDGISMFLNFPLKDIKFTKLDDENHLGIVYCMLLTGDLFFIDFSFEFIESGILKEMVKYKYTLLRKSSFQDSKLIDFKIFDVHLNKNLHSYDFVLMDRYGNYTNGIIRNLDGDKNLKVELNTSKQDDFSFKGSFFDQFNMELPYKQLIKGTNSDSMFLIDNTKIISVNKVTKQSVLITQHKFWSRIISCVDICEFLVIFTTMELIITRKLEDKAKNSFLERVISVRHYFKLLNYNDLSVQAYKDNENGILIVFIKPLNILYFFSISPETGDLSLMNNIPVSCIFKDMSLNNNTFIYFEGESIYFLSYFNKVESLQKVNLIKKALHKCNLKTIKKVVFEPEYLNDFEREDLLRDLQNEVTFEKEFGVKGDLLSFIERKIKTNAKLQATEDEENQIQLLEQFGELFYKRLQEIIIGQNIVGSLKMSQILSLPKEITSTVHFNNFNEQLCNFINKKTTFKVIKIYDTDETNIEKIWRNQLLLFNTETMNQKGQFLQMFKDKKDDNFALLKNSLENWSTTDFASFKEPDNSLIRDSLSIYSKKKNPFASTSTAGNDLDQTFPSQLPSTSFDAHLYSQNDEISNWNDSSFVVSTQKLSQDEHNLKASDGASAADLNQQKKKKKDSSKKTKAGSQSNIKKVKKTKKVKKLGSNSGFL